MRTLLVFARAPVLGQVKTRISNRTSAEFALRLYQALLTRTLAMVEKVAAETCLYVEGISSECTVNSELPTFVQRGRELGERMANALMEAFNRGSTECIVIGSDCPALTPSLIEMAFQSLINWDVVIGPALDGGYYLIGMNKHRRELFEGISWSGPTVMAQTIKIIHEAHLSFSLLPVLSDVDEVEDIPAEMLQELS